MSVEKFSRHSFSLWGLPHTPLKTFLKESFETSKNFNTKKYGGSLLHYNQHSRDNPGDFFPMPKAAFRLGLDSGEIAVLAFLMYCED